MLRQSAKKCPAPGVKHARLCALIRIIYIRLIFQLPLPHIHIYIRLPHIHIYIYKVIDRSDIFINGKIVDYFNILDKNYIYIYTLNVSATQQLHRIIMEQKNETNDLKTDLKTRLARLEAKNQFFVNTRWKRKQRNRCLERRMYIIRNDRLNYFYIIL
jgi:hypothetical protein